MTKASVIHSSIASLYGINPKLSRQEAHKDNAASADTRGGVYQSVSGGHDMDLTDYTFEKPLVTKFWKRVDTTGGDTACWDWKGSKTAAGYGNLRMGSRITYAHRFSYALTYGNFDSHMFVMHRCDRPCCVNPMHLQLGTSQDNMSDRNKKGRTNKGEARPTAKLTEAQVLLIRQRHKAGSVTKVGLAREYGVSHVTIFNIIARKLWAYLEDAS